MSHSGERCCLHSHSSKDFPAWIIYRIATLVNVMHRRLPGLVDTLVTQDGEMAGVGGWAVSTCISRRGVISTPSRWGLSCQVGTVEGSSLPHACTRVHRVRAMTHLGTPSRETKAMELLLHHYHHQWSLPPLPLRGRR